MRRALAVADRGVLSLLILALALLASHGLTAPVAAGAPTLRVDDDTGAVSFTPTLGTVIKDSVGTPVTSVPTGTTVHDTATLTGASSNAGGTVTYNRSNNGTCSGTPATQTVTVTNAEVPDSAPFTPPSAGSYSYWAVYSGDANNNGATSACESLTVLTLVTVNSTADTNTRDSVMTLREAMLLAIGDIVVTDLTWDECQQVSGASWSVFLCMSAFPIGTGNPETIVFDPSVFPSGSPATISLGSHLPILDTGGDTIDGSSAGVIVDGVSEAFNCFSITSNDNTIKGLEIYNCNMGIDIALGGDNNTIGGTTASERNVISGNYEAGVCIRGDGTDSNAVKGNYIGTNSAGTTALAGQEYGILISSAASQNSVGGSTPGERNLVSGNAFAGVAIHGHFTSGNVVKGNYIGTGAGGVGALPNGDGVEIANAPTGDPASNVIGGTTAGEGNVIAYNDGDGVFVSADHTEGNTIRGNSIHSNGDKGIDIIVYYETELAPPIITGFVPVMGTACANCTVDIYSDDEDEGRVYEGSATANGSGNWTFSGSGTLHGPNITAMATDAAGNTSEFSAPMLVDSDRDGFINTVEAYLATDPFDACPDGPTDDAWPLDVSKDGQISVVGDVLNFRGRIGATPGSPNWRQRLDFNMDSQLSVVGDVLLYRGRIGDTCT